MNESFLTNQTNNALEQKPRIRWKSALILFLLSFFAIPYYYFGYFSYESLALIFGLITATLCSLVYIFAIYRAEKKILKGNFNWKWLIIFNITITIILYALAFLFIFTFLIGLFVEAEQGALDSFVLSVIYFIPAVVIIFSLVPSLILKRFYPDAGKVNKILFIFFLVTTIIVFAYSWASSNSCDFNRNIECVADKADESGNVALCESFKEDKKRDSCYRGAITGRNLYEEDLIMCDQIKEQDIQDFCYKEVSITTKDKEVLRKTCGKIKNAGDDMNKCYTNLSKVENDIMVCDKVAGYDKNRCVANIAVNNNDSSLCDKYLNKEKEKSSCYKEMATTKKWQDISICDKASSAGDDKYYCEVYILENFSDIPSCKEAKKTSYSHLMSQCRRDYHNIKK
mgnify:FL=1